MNIKVGSILKIKNIEAHVIGWITYKNTYDGNKTWTEYRLMTNRGEVWLSMDDFYSEYSVSWPANDVRGRISSKWHEVDRGHQVVTGCSGDVDVERGDEADFIEYEDITEENTLSAEIWDDGTEYSRGEYIELSDIQITGYKKPKFNIYKLLGSQVFWAFAFFIFILLFAIADSLPPLPKYIDKYLKKSQSYEYVTSITGNEKQKADVYEYTGAGNTSVSISYGSYKSGGSSSYSTDYVAKDIIDGIEGQTESVTQEDGVSDAPIAIVTKSEYCLIYHPEDDADKVYIQISKRKYNYASDNSPYKSSESTTRWYRSHYYSSSYRSDSKKYSHTPSAYESYTGETIYDIGGSYYDSYSSSVRQSSINSRRSSSGGGK